LAIGARQLSWRLAGVGTADPQPDGDLVLGGDDVFDVRLKVGKGVLHRLEVLPQGLAAPCEWTLRAARSRTCALRILALKLPLYAFHHVVVGHIRFTVR
jgi:hypothetical protein